VLDLVFMGTPEFAATILAALIDTPHRILAVYTQPARPRGRGHRPQASPVEALARRHRLVVRTPESLRGSVEEGMFAALGAEAVVVAAYGLILPAAMLAAPRLGCFNVHTSLLPRWRGAAPIQRALLAGDRETGITIMAMEAGLDTGPILLQQALPIGPDITTGELEAGLAALGARLIVGALDLAEHGRLIRRPQSPEGITYARKIGREEGRLDWRRPAAELERRVRAFDPSPGAFFEHAGERIRVLRAAAVAEPSDRPPGSVIDGALSIACGEGVLRLLRVQRAGRAPLAAAEFLRGFPIPAGTVLACPATS
jgi:methionyl-tRNA formyltransferase